MGVSLDDTDSSIDIKKYQQTVSESNIQSDWQYLSEGNKHIVFRYLPIDGILKSLILKMNKTPNETEDIFPSHHVAQRWLGSDYVDDIIHPIHIPESFALKLVSKFQHQRPAKRRKKHPLRRINDHSNSSHSVYHCSLERNAFELESDADSKEKEDGLSVFTVDLKPKWMFLDRSPLIPDDDIKKSLCRFSMHQMFKFNVSKSIDSVSSFCPLSLLSTNRKVIELNVERLLIAKQSNFKLFHQNIDSMIRCDDDLDESSRIMIIKAVSSLIVDHKDLLRRISMLQRLDRFGIAVIHRMWIELKMKKKIKVIQETLSDPLLLNDIVDRLQTEYETTTFGADHCFCGAMDDLNFQRKWK